MCTNGRHETIKDKEFYVLSGLGEILAEKRGLSRQRQSRLSINGLDRINRVVVYHRCDPPSSPPGPHVAEMKTTIHGPIRVRFIRPRSLQRLIVPAIVGTDFSPALANDADE
jgi:hypothetical protein